MALSGRVDIDRGALDDLVNGAIGQRILAVTGDHVRDQARRNAGAISSRLADALWTDDPKVDAQGAYVDVGYNKARPGWVLWFHEVGTVNHPARPHLRPALTQG